jgi:predicted nucleotidyltransferase
MRSGILNANLIELNEEFKLPFVPDLIEAKIHGKEKQTLPEVDMSFHETEVHRLLDLLEQAGENSQLPNEPSSRGGLNDLLLRIRKSF